jgi:hypothetical protein
MFFLRQKDILTLLHFGQAKRHKMIARWQSYRGVTIATLSLSGRTSLRSAFDPYMLPVVHVAPRLMNIAAAIVGTTADAQIHTCNNISVLLSTWRFRFSASESRLSGNRARKLVLGTLCRDKRTISHRSCLVLTSGMPVFVLRSEPGVARMISSTESSKPRSNNAMRFAILLLQNRRVCRLHKTMIT